MTSPKTLGTAIGIIAASGLGGYFIGRSQNSRDSIFVRKVSADLKPTLDAAPSSFPGTSLHPVNPRLSDSDVTSIADSSSALSVGLHRTAEIMKFGFPTTDTVRARSDYVIAYDRKNRTALWVAEHLTPERLKDRTKVSRAARAYTLTFEALMSTIGAVDLIGAIWQLRETTGLIRNHWTKPFFSVIFLHSVMLWSYEKTRLYAKLADEKSLDFDKKVKGRSGVKVGVGFNRDAWNKLEQYARFKTRSCANVFVVTGPLYLPSLAEDGKNYINYQVIGPQNVAVPSHFFKALLCQSPDGAYHLETYVLPNKPIDAAVPLQAFQVPPDAIERAAGFLLFEGLPRARLQSVNGRNSGGDTF